MRTSLVIILALLIIPAVLIGNFPGARILLYGLLTSLGVCWVYMRIAANALEIKRNMDTYQIFPDIPEPTRLIFSNKSSFPIHAMTALDSSDLNISKEQRHHYLLTLDRKGQTEFQYLLHGRKRGQFQVGPTTLQFSDLLGIFSFEYEFKTSQNVIVYPTIYRIVNMRYKSMQPQGIIRNDLPIFEDPTIITGLRGYQFGDDIKKINWKVSARQDKFMVNTYQPSISAASLIILNLYEQDYDFRGSDPYKEKAIEVAASLLRNLFQYRQEIGLATNCSIDKEDKKIVTNLAKSETHLTGILRNLAIIHENKTCSLKEFINPTNLNLNWGGTLFILTTRLDESALPILFDYQKAGHPINLINIGPKIRTDMSLWNVGFRSYYAEIQDNVINLLRM